MQGATGRIFREISERFQRDFREISERSGERAGSEREEFKEVGEVSGCYLFSLNSLLKLSPPQNKNCPTPYEPSSGDIAH